MTKRDFEAIAKALYTVSRETGRGVEDETWQMTRKELAEVLGASNERFQLARFLHACETGEMRLPKAKGSKRQTGWLCSVCERPFTVLSGGVQGCPVHGIREGVANA